MNTNPVSVSTENKISIRTEGSTIEEPLSDTSVNYTTTESNVVPNAKKTIALLGNPFKANEDSNTIIKLIDVNIGDGFYIATKKITTDGRNIISFRINKNLQEAIEDPNHPKHNLAIKLMNRQLAFASQEAINPTTPDKRVMSVDEYTTRVGLQRLKVGFYDDIISSKRDYLIDTVENFIKKERFEEAANFIKERFMFDQELTQIFNDYKSSNSSSIQRYSEAIFNLPGIKVPIKIQCHSPSSISNTYEKCLKEFGALEKNIKDLSLHRTKEIIIVEDAPFAGRADSNENMILKMTTDVSPLWIPRILKHEEQHFRTRIKFGDGTSHSDIYHNNTNVSEDPIDSGKPTTLEHEFIGGAEGSPKLLLSELLSYRTECTPMLSKLEDPTFYDSKDFTDLLKYNRKAKIALKQLEEIKDTHLSKIERRQLDLVKKSWENLDKKIEPYLAEILTRISNHRKRECRREEYHLLIDEHKKAGNDGEYPPVLGQLIDHETNYRFLEDLVDAQEGEVPKELQDRAAKRYMSTKFQEDQKDWKITLNLLLASNSPSLRYRGYKYTIESFKAANSDEKKQEFLKLFTDSINKEENWKPLEKLILSSKNNEIPKEFQDIAAKRYMSKDFQENQFHWDVTLNLLLQMRNGIERNKGYDYLIQSYRAADDKNKDKYFEMFTSNVKDETYFYSIHYLGRGKGIPPEMQKFAQERFMNASLKEELTKGFPESFKKEHNWFSYKYCANFYEWTTSQEEKRLYFSIFETAINSESNTSSLNLVTNDDEIPEELRSLASKRLSGLEA